MVSSICLAFLGGKQSCTKWQRPGRHQTIIWITENTWRDRYVPFLVKDGIACTINWLLPADEIISVGIPELEQYASWRVAMPMNGQKFYTCGVFGTLVHVRHFI